MDKIDTTTEIPEENQPTQSLGELLKSYRESAAMDYDQAADTLCLTAATLQALENEQFDLLPEAPYIRGYLRSYAKLANVSSAEAIALYEEIRGGTSIAANLQDNFAPTSSVASIIKPTISPLLVRFGFIAVIILSLAVISMLPDVREWSSAIWTDFSEKTVAIEQQSQQEQTSEVVATAAENSANTSNSTINSNDTVASKEANATQANTQTGTENPNTVPQTQAALSNMDGKINRQGQSTLAENTAADANDKNTNKPQNVTPQNTENKTAIETEANTTTVTPATGNTNINTPKPPIVATAANNNANAAINPSSTTSANASQTAAVSNNGANVTANETSNNPDGTVVASTTNPSDSNPTAEGENSDAETPTETQANEVSVKLVFSKEVWMRVNSKKKKVFSGLKKAGDTEEFKATKPLSFKVGNAPGVEIYINGQRYDQAPHTRGAVSRFKIEDTP